MRTFSKEQLNGRIREPIRIDLPSGDILCLESEGLGGDAHVKTITQGKVRTEGFVENFPTLVQILRALVQKGSKIPEEDQTYLKNLLPKERERSPKKQEANPDACPFCGAIGQLIDSRAFTGTFYYIQCPKCEAQTGLTYSEDQAWARWRRRNK